MLDNSYARRFDHTCATFCVTAQRDNKRFVYATARTLGAARMMARGLSERGMPNRRGYLRNVTDVRVTCVETTEYRAADYMMSPQELSDAGC